MKVKLKIKGIFDNGCGVKTITRTIHIDEHFEEKNVDIDKLKVNDELKVLLKKANQNDSFTFSIEEQVDSYIVDNSNNIIKNIMDKESIFNVIDWKIVSVGTDKKKTSNTLIKKHQNLDIMMDILDHQIISDDIRNEFIAYYFEMKDTIKHLKVNDQIKIVFATITASAKTASNTLKELREFQDNIKNNKLLK